MESWLHLLYLIVWGFGFGEPEPHFKICIYQQNKRRLDLLTLPCYGYSQGFIDTTLWVVSLADVDILS